jgi:heme exporter protein D
MTHEMFVFLCYAITALVIILMLLWVIFDGRLQQKELRRLEAAGVKRRSDAAS